MSSHSSGGHGSMTQRPQKRPAPSKCFPPSLPLRPWAGNSPEALWPCGPRHPGPGRAMTPLFFWKFPPVSESIQGLGAARPLSSPGVVSGHSWGGGQLFGAILGSPQISPSSCERGVFVKCSRHGGDVTPKLQGLWDGAGWGHSGVTPSALPGPCPLPAAQTLLHLRTGSGTTRHAGQGVRLGKPKMLAGHWFVP